jgi:hypothetical protein
MAFLTLRSAKESDQRLQTIQAAHPTLSGRLGPMGRSGRGQARDQRPLWLRLVRFTR